jgi:hypothetical protein
MVAPNWNEPIATPPPPTPPLPPAAFTSHPDSVPRAEMLQYGRDLLRHAHEREAYDAAIAARSNAEQYAHAMGFGMGMGIPPGYSPSSGDLDQQQGGYGEPYAYAVTTPPLGVGGAGLSGGVYGVGAEGAYGNRCEEEGEEEDIGEDVRMGGRAARSNERITYSGDGRHEGG